MKKSLTGVVCAVLMVMAMNLKVKAQEIELAPFDTLAKSVITLQSDMELLKRLKFSGYLQPQFQLADTAGISSFAGGNFPATSNNRFALRRGRLKATYEYKNSQFVLQFDATEKGFAIKDAYAKFTDPWMNTFSLTGGVMNRPFGFEIGYSSSVRESPERGRMSQIIFPGEREVGAMLTIQAPKTSKWNWLKLDVGAYNGNGVGSGYSSHKDIIGRLGINRTSKSGKVIYSGGLSMYNGGLLNVTKYVYNYNVDSNAFIVDSTPANKNSNVKRQYMGADVQVSIDFPFGITTLRGEYIMGQQTAYAASAFPASLSSSSGSPSNLASAPVFPIYSRNFNGAYFYLLQNIGQSRHQLVLKYDWYDPNTEIAGNKIGDKGVGKRGKDTKVTNGTDIKFSTIGIGWSIKATENLKFVAYYDLVSNETTTNIKSPSTLKTFETDQKDNVFTLRMQYKF